MRTELREGSQVGRYVLLTRLAQGGMANVWLARTTEAEGLHKTVVVKTLLPGLADDPEFVGMFAREALIAAQLEHPNIVRIFDLGEADGHYYITMEHIAGRTLRHVKRELRRSKLVPPPWMVLRVVSSVCDALHYAHEKRDDKGLPLGLIHRDVSPENIMVSFAGETKVLDFGIAKATTVASGKTRVGVLKGKFAYMAPEQIEGAMEGVSPTRAVDIYSLGVVMYELITGVRPFRAQNDIALMRQILDREPAAPESFCSWVSPSLSELILKAMARDPGQRYGTALELRKAIDDYFEATKSQPTSRHVAEYVRSLFGDGTSEPAAPLLPTPAGGGSSRDSYPGDPWELEANAATGRDSSLTIDLSMVLLSSEDSKDGPPDSRTEQSPAPPNAQRSSFPPSSLALPPVGWQPAGSGDSAALPGKGAGAERGLSFGTGVDDLPDWGPMSTRWGAAAVEVRPENRAPVLPPPVEEAPMRQLSERSGAEGRRHFWDVATERAREAKAEAEAEPAEPTRVRDAGQAREGHAWDAVVDRIRREEGDERGQRGADRRGMTSEARATRYFEEGLERMRAKDLDGALACWTKAVELEPDNRRYQSNLRVLKRQLAEREKAG